MIKAPLAVEPEVECTIAAIHPRAQDGLLRWKARAEQVHDDILLIHNAIPLTDDIPALAERHSDTFDRAGVVRDGQQYVDPAQRNTDRLSLGRPTTPPELAFYEALCHALEPHFAAGYQRIVNKHAIVTATSGYELLRYKVGGFFKEHVDTIKDHPIFGHRRLAAVAFCNDDFEGGELCFPRQNIEIAPEPGLLILFPANFTHPHEVKPITDGVRYTIITWFH